MSPIENIVDVIHTLSSDEKHKLRLLLDAELAIAPAATPSNANGRAKRIIGLFADEPELMDRVMESVLQSKRFPLGPGSQVFKEPT